MRAIYDSGIPISFKGSMVLKACLVEAGYSEDTRHTVDIDGNWNTDSPPSAEQMVESLQSALQKAGIDLNVSIYRMYGEGRSAGFELQESATGEILFTMDIDVNRSEPPTKIYEIIDKTNLERGSGGIICMCEEVIPINSRNSFIPCNLI